MDESNLSAVTTQLERGDFELALRILEAPSAAGADSAERQYLRGKALSGLERDSEAIDAFTLALERRPDWPEALLARAAAAYSTASLDCLYDLERLIELQPDNVELELLYAQRVLEFGDGVGAVLHLREAIRKSANPPIEYVYQLAFWLYESEKYDESLVAVDEVLARDRDHLDAWKLRGELVTWCDRPPAEHVEATRRLMELDKDGDHSADYVSALLYAEEYDDVIQEATRLIRNGYASEHADVYLSRGSALYYLGRYSEALSDFEEGFRRSKPDDGSRERYRSRGQCYAKLGRIEDALRDYDRVIRGTEYPIALSERAELLIRLKRFTEALQDLETSVQIFSGMEERRSFHELRLQCYEALGREQEAQATRKRLEELPEEAD